MKDAHKKETAQYFKLAANKGIKDSKIVYAAMFFEGDGIEINKKEASEY